MSNRVTRSTIQGQVPLKANTKGKNKKANADKPKAKKTAQNGKSDVPSVPQTESQPENNEPATVKPVRN